MQNYLDLMWSIIEKGEVRSDRTNTGTKSLFSTKLTFDLQKGFPIVTTKKVFFNKVVHELLWFLKGDDTTHYLENNNSNIWKYWETEDKEVGPIYGVQWTRWNNKHNQIQTLIDGIKHNPYSRRHIVNAWNVDYLPDESISPQDNVKQGKMCLAPCHVLFQLYVREDTYLDMQMYQRSADIFIGVPYNISSYSLLLSMIAHVTGYKPGVFNWIGGDTHIYLNHIDAALTQLKRKPKLLPTLHLNPGVKDIFDFTIDDICLEGYDPDPYIKVDIAV